MNEIEQSVTRQRVIALVAAVGLLLGGSGAACGYFAYSKARAAEQVATAQARAADRDAAIKAGSEFLTTMFTIDDGSLDRWEKSVLAATTDGMHEQLAQWKTVLQKLISAHVDMSSTVKDVGVVSQNGDAVTLLAIIESSGRADPAAAQPSPSDSAALVDLRRIDGQWKIQGYGPAGGKP
ncbi:hypothetical protein JMUB6875_07140 [Nocardia sp. JMUB6875]|uniref:hypothetical protein n=1 Tax=Nocardia sp. JMUB6875 TaxID=3158170 RepID=UPI0032E75A06